MARSQAHLIYQFRDQAGQDFERRMAKVCTTYVDYLDNPTRRGSRHDVREISAELMTMSEDERYVLLHRVMGDTSGPKTLEGMEALSSFVGNYLLDDSTCKVVKEPNAKNPYDDPYFTSALDLAAGDGLDESAALDKALAMYEDRDRPLVVVPAGDDTPAGPFELLAAIEHNRALESKRKQAFDEAVGESYGWPTGGPPGP